MIVFALALIPALSLPPMQPKERPGVQRYLHPILKQFIGSHVEAVINGRRVVCRVAR